MGGDPQASHYDLLLRKFLISNIKRRLTVPSPWDEFEPTKSKKSVMDFLKSLDYNVPPQRSFYRQLGNQYRNPDKQFTVKLVRKYVREHALVSANDTMLTGDDIGGLAVDKLRAEMMKTQEQARREQLKRQKEEGKLGSREDFELGQAARIAVIDLGIKQWISLKSPELIALVSGDQQKKHDLEALFLAFWDERMSSFSKNINYEVIFE